MAQLPRTIEIIDYSTETAWYKDHLNEEFVVIESWDGYYMVETWDDDGENVLAWIFITDCKTVNR